MRAISYMLVLLFCAAVVRAETLEGLSQRVSDIQKGNNTGNQIEDLRVRDAAAIGGDASVGDDLTVAGDATVGGLLTQTRQTVSATKGAVTITPTANNIVIEGHYGVVTASVAAATSPGGQVVNLINTVGTNVVFNESTGLQLPAGYGSITNGQWDILSLVSYGTNWICTGWQDN